MHCILHTSFVLLWLAATAPAADAPPAAPPPAKKPRAAEKPAAPADKPPAEPPAKAEVPEKRVQELIKQLGDKDYFVRQRAQNELMSFGVEALDALLVAANTSDDLEIATRAKYLLKLMRVVWTDKNDPPEVKRLLTDYENQRDERTKVAKMQALADLPGGAGVAALCRLIRYEKSTVLSKQAAIHILMGQPRNVPPDKKAVEIVRQNLAQSQRPAAKWLMTWAELADNPQAVVAQWGKWIESEQPLLPNKNETNKEIVAALVRLHVDWLKRLDQTDKAMAAMRNLLDLEEGEADTLVELLDWLVERKEWKAIDDLAQRFQVPLQREPLPLYILAQAFVAQGDKPRAEKTAELAFKLNPGKELTQIDLHRFPTASQLRQRGLYDWAEREYRYVIENAPAAHDVAAAAAYALSEMFHDLDKNEQAAKTLDDAIRAAKEQGRGDNVLSRRAPGEIASRMHYFYACHYQGKNDAAKAKEHLKKAVESPEPDIDALIACYRLPGQPAEERKKLVELIKKTADAMQQEINDQPTNATNYNQYAWLVGNTEGDKDAAIRYSKRSIELMPDAGGYYDTLGHAYAGKGDYKNAVEAQTKAAKLEPHSRQIHEKLKLFQEKLKEQEKK